MVRKAASRLEASGPIRHSNQDLLRRLFDLNTVFEIAHRFHAVLDSHALLDGIIMTAIGQLGVGAAAVAVQSSGDADRLTVTRSKGWVDVHDEDWQVDLKSTLARVLEHTRQPVLVSELLPVIGQDAHFTSFLQRTGCALIAPFYGRDRLRGVLFTAGKLSGQPFSETDIEFLNMVIKQVSVAIDNALLYESERRYARELLEARDRLARTERLATLGRLAAAIAHEVNNPLGIIRNYLQVIRTDLADRPETMESVGIVADEVDRIARIVRQLLDAFRPDASRPAAIDVGDVLNGALEFLEPELMRDRVRVESKVANDLPYVIGREDPLRQVFINLALNARDAMHDGGTLRVTAEISERFVTISFADEGCGLSGAALDQLFDPFFSTKESGRGTGLGLSICRTILEGFGGQIEASNVPAPECGAVFHVHLPRVDSTEDTELGTPS